jgi:hypothetical protein
VGLKNIDLSKKKANIGIVIGEKKFWRKGIGTEAVLKIFWIPTGKPVAPLGTLHLRRSDLADARNTHSRPAKAGCSVADVTV